ncbi:MAG: hypothetical protein CR972_03335 [Candidatus Moraniibacteriota bacterium]|nr:MAG: hypothetical protein CR972_03335 [Candidatus Moranbacteria bacterium]
MTYFSGKISQDLTYLYISRAIVYFSNGFFSMFFPIFLYKTFSENLNSVLFFYLIGALLCLILYPLSTKHIEKFNLKNALFIATIANIFFLLTMSITTKENIHNTIIVAIFFLTIFRLFYWLPYHTIFTTFSDQKNRMREVSAFMATMHLIGIITPLIAGIIISKTSYQTLFISGLCVYACSLFPLISLSNVFEKYSWTYFETWKNLCAKKYRPAMIAYFADGIESGIGIVIWPIFVYSILHGDYISIGAISAATISITVLLELILGKYADSKRNKKDMLKINSILYACGWIAKIFIVTGFHIFIIDAYHKITNALSKGTFSAITYDISADHGHYVDEFTVIKEMALNCGRIVLYGSTITLASFINIEWTFLIAAIATLSVNTIRLQKSQIHH